MGWLDKASKGPTPSSDGAYEAPDRTSRARCWEARDAYFSCLDRVGILDSIKDQDEALRQCRAESEQLDRECASSWVEYFKKRRVAEWKKEETLKQLEQNKALKIN